MPLADLQKAYKTWFDFHDQLESGKEAGWTTKDFNGKTFIFSKRILEVGKEVPYKLVLGYAVNAGILKCRMWYYSGSEATWRAFTGWRTGGAWQKGAEFEGGENRVFTGLGYIFECYTTVEFGEALQEFWEANPSEKLEYLTFFPWPTKNDGNDAWVIPPVSSDPLRGMFEYLVGPYKTESETKDVEKGVKKPKPSLIGTSYNKQRAFVKVNMPAGISEEAKKLTTEVASVKIQKQYSVDLTGRRIGVGHTLKKDTPLNSWLISCLQFHTLRDYKRYHPVLKMDYTVCSFQLNGNSAGSSCPDNLIVEIATTDNDYDHPYIDMTGSEKILKTRICWVRDVYYASSGITEFGTRDRIPINLAFLVQKPCDYKSQISAFYNEKVPFKNPANFFGGKYIVLSLLNESTSSLVKTFKSSRDLPCFVSKYYSHAKLNLDNRTEELKASILKGVFEYADLQDTKGNPNPKYATTGYHGSAGMQRAEALHDAVCACKNFVELSQVIYNCFANNRVGSFTGNRFTSSIQTKPTSLFTCVCRNLLNQFAVNAPSAEIERAQLLGRQDRSMKYGGFTSDSGAINRMVYYIHYAPIPAEISADLFITSEAPQLLLALRG